MTPGGVRAVRGPRTEQLDLAIFMAYFMANSACVETRRGANQMMTANISELKDHLSEFLRRVEDGDEVVITKRNVPFATIVPRHT